MNPDSDVYDKWIDGVDVYFTNAIIKNISYPPTEEFVQVWRLLCQWSHATVYAGQAGVRLSEAREGTIINVGFSEVFVQWIYHLMYRHMLTPTVRYYGDRYADTRKSEKARLRLKKAFKYHKKYLAPGSLRLIKDFQATWRQR
jgi:hypothetical protein